MTLLKELIEHAKKMELLNPESRVWHLRIHRWFYYRARKIIEAMPLLILISIGSFGQKPDTVKHKKFFYDPTLYDTSNNTWLLDTMPKRNNIYLMPLKLSPFKRSSERIFAKQ